MASLRARLLAAVLALAAIGLLLVGGVTYAEQRSFLYDRVDQQLRSASAQIGPALERAMSGQTDGGFEDSGGRGPGHGPDFGPPSGTYGEKRSADGRVLFAKVFSVNSTVTAKPALPADLPLDHIITVKGQNGAGRAIACSPSATRATRRSTWRRSRCAPPTTTSSGCWSSRPW
jgi:two-component system OmpR family sensor kinase